jgi:hypothetical protein
MKEKVWGEHSGQASAPGEVAAKNMYVFII